MHFFEHFTFDKTDYSERGKHMKKYIRVVVAVELVTVVHYLNMSEINKIRIVGRRSTYSISCRLGVFFCFIPNLRKEKRQWILIIFMAEEQINLLFIKYPRF